MFPVGAFDGIGWMERVGNVEELKLIVLMEVCGNWLCYFRWYCLFFWLLLAVIVRGVW